MSSRLVRAGGLIGLIGLAVIAALVPSLPVAARIVLGLPGVLVVPGYAVVFALWPARGLAGEVRWVLSLGAGLAVDVLVGLATAALPVGLSAGSVVTGLAGVTVVAVAVGFIREGSPSEPAIRRRPSLGVRTISAAIAVVIAIALAVTSVVVANRGASTADRKTQFTQLYLEPDLEGSNEVQVGIQSFERDPTTFRLVLVDTDNGASIMTVAGIELARTQSIEKVLAVPSEVSRADLRVDLYRAGQSAAYRSVTVG